MEFGAAWPLRQCLTRSYKVSSRWLGYESWLMDCKQSVVCGGSDRRLLGPTGIGALSDIFTGGLAVGQGSTLMTCAEDCSPPPPHLPSLLACTLLLPSASCQPFLCKWSVGPIQCCCHLQSIISSYRPCLMGSSQIPGLPFQLPPLLGTRLGGCPSPWPCASLPSPALITRTPLSRVSLGETHGPPRLLLPPSQSLQGPPPPV